MISEKVKKIRNKMGLTQALFAKMVGSNQAMISLIETDKAMPSYRMLERLTKLAKKTKTRIKFI